MSQATPAFSDLALSAPILDALSRIGYEQPSPIQAESIPHLLNGDDLLGTAQTGTGKTAAFALPLLTRLDLSKAEPQILVLVPTRELAIQVAEAFQTYASQMKGFHVLPIYGGQPMGGQLRQLSRGAHVVVGTPGRVMDHLRRNTLKLAGIKSVVLDEADEMLRMGFIDDVTWILEQAPKERQVALFSATMPKPIKRVADTYLRNPKEVKIEPQTTSMAKIEQCYWTVSGVNKLDALTRMLEVEEFDGIIMFVRTKTQTVELADKLEARGYAASAINGDMTQKLREQTIEQLKAGKTDILVATDVAARGIDVSRISHVINYDIPYDTEAYVHRIGRTGRAGRTGKAILFVSPREKRLLHAIEKATGQRITAMDLPSKEQVNQKRIAQFKTTISEALTHSKLEFFHNIIEELMNETSVEPLELAGALAYLVQKDNPLILNETAQPERKRKDRDTPRDRDSFKGKGRDRDSFADSDKKRAPRNRSESRSERGSRDEAMPEMERYRLAVGRNQEVKPGDIVGAIANEAGIDSQYIGRIELHDDFSTVDLPQGMPKEIFDHLKKVYVRNQPLHIEKLASASQDGKANKGRSYAKGGDKAKSRSKSRPDDASKSAGKSRAPKESPTGPAVRKRKPKKP
jgi:ATP-dependent RNA helicase DeaD